MPNKAPWEQKLMIKQQELSSCQTVIRCTDKHFKSPIEDGNSIYLVSVQVIFFYLPFFMFFTFASFYPFVCLTYLRGHTDLTICKQVSQPTNRRLN